MFLFPPLTAYIHPSIYVIYVTLQNLAQKKAGCHNHFTNACKTLISLATLDREGKMYRNATLYCAKLTFHIRKETIIAPNPCGV